MDAPSGFASSFSKWWAFTWSDWIVQIAEIVCGVCRQHCLLLVVIFTYFRKNCFNHGCVFSTVQPCQQWTEIRRYSASKKRKNASKKTNSPKPRNSWTNPYECTKPSKPNPFSPLSKTRNPTQHKTQTPPHNPHRPPPNPLRTWTVRPLPMPRPLR